MMNYFVSACGKITPRKHHRLIYGIFLVFVMLGAAQSALAYQANISGGAASVAVNQPIAANFVVTLTGGDSFTERATIVETTCGTLNPASPSQTLKTDGTEDLTFTFTAPGVSGSCTITAKGDTGVGDVTSTTFVVTITSISSSTTSTTTTVSSSSTTSSATTTTLVPVHGSLDGLGSHTFPTYLFVASYDWLHNFHDANDEATRGGNQTDPDTDNFNKVITLDSNLFPIANALDGDQEFPNITARNTTTWAGTAAPSPYSPSVNDYFNRSIAVTSDFIEEYNIPYQIGREATTDTAGANGIVQYGGRSAMNWAFVLDPGNHNLRRYELVRREGFFWSYDDEEGELSEDVYNADDVCDITKFGIDSTDCSLASKGNCCGGGSCDGPFKNIFLADVTFLDGTTGERAIRDGFLDMGVSNVFTWCRSSGNYAESGSDLNTKAEQDAVGILEFYMTVSDEQMQKFNDWGYIPLTLTAADTDANVVQTFVAINAKCFSDACSVSGTERDPGPTASVTNLWKNLADFSHQQAETLPSAGPYSYVLSNNIDATWDVDSTTSGVQLRLSITTSKHGGLVLGYASIGDSAWGDRAFGVKLPGDDYFFEVEPGAKEARWNNISTFLEIVPPESYPGYESYTSFINGTVGYGFQTNTSFRTASNVRFKNPRDVDAYRDIFDAGNGGPTYAFVADTMNSRIQVFMNATGSAGFTGQVFPIRPVPVKGPNDTSTNTAFKSNELGMRIYSSVGSSRSSLRFGDGRKVDWRQYTTLPGSSFINITAGRGEFYYPHGVAVDQDPDTKDVYLFVADTFNHRIQVFRDATGVTFQPITSKKFDFEFERSWGTYPLQTSEVRTPPGAYNFRYPKGLDIARFANNSSYLYVVDSKNYRVLKYLITESAEDISSISFVAGYGSNGTTFVRDLGSNHGVALDSNLAFEDDGLLAVGFLNPQDVSTGYSGFYLYSGPVEAGQSFRNEIYPDPANANLRRGVRYLNNYMLYVSDYARNNNSVDGDDLNMRVMQFIDNFQTINGVFLPWKTEAVTFTHDAITQTLGQSAFGLYSGVYRSDAKSGVGGTTKSAGTGSTENAGVNDRFTDRPVGVAALNWNTITPMDMRVVDLSSKTVFSNGTTIDKDTLLRVGARSREFFGLPYSNITTYTNYTTDSLGLDGKWIKRIHAFCYDTNSVFRGHTALPAPPFVFTPNDISSSCTGYMKVVAEDIQFAYTGKTGTLIFKMKP